MYTHFKGALKRSRHPVSPFIRFVNVRKNNDNNKWSEGTLSIVAVNWTCCSVFNSWHLSATLALHIIVIVLTSCCFSFGVPVNIWCHLFGSTLFLFYSQLMSPESLFFYTMTFVSLLCSFFIVLNISLEDCSWKWASGWNRHIAGNEKSICISPTSVTARCSALVYATLWRGHLMIQNVKYSHLNTVFLVKPLLVCTLLQRPDFSERNAAEWCWFSWPAASICAQLLPRWAEKRIYY